MDSDRRAYLTGIIGAVGGGIAGGVLGFGAGSNAPQEFDSERTGTRSRPTSTPDSTTRCGWKIHGESPLEYNAGDPGYIIENGTHYLYPTISHGKKKGTIEVWESRGGLQFDRIRTVIRPGDQNWMGKRVSDASIESHDGRFYLAFTGTDSSGRKSIGIATAASPTGPFSSVSRNPVLTGGTQAEWDHDRVTEPYIRLHPDGERLLMTYSGEADALGTERIGYASSPDGVNWVKADSNPIWESSVPEGGINDQAHRYEDETWYLYFTDKGEPNHPMKRVQGESLDSLGNERLILDTPYRDWSPAIRKTSDGRLFMYWHQQTDRAALENTPSDVLARSKRISLATATVERC
jgi:predicted GH43/DUF377 family glycosyl hydrolase